MDLKDFVKNVLSDIVVAVEEARTTSARDMHLSSHKESNQTVEFDIAVAVEDTQGGEGKTGIKVFKMIEAGGNVSQEFKNSTVSRIKFGVYISAYTKDEQARLEQQNRDIQNRGEYDPYSPI